MLHAVDCDWSFSADLCVSIPSCQILVPGTSTTTLLEQLVPNTPYNVGVVAIYANGEGPPAEDKGTTRKIQYILSIIYNILLPLHVYPHPSICLILC